MTAIAELEQRIAAFVREEVIPREAEARAAGDHGPADALIAELRARARAAGLLAPHVGRDWGGLGLSHAEQARAFRAAGYSTLGPIALNCAAPDEGNMHLLEKVATPEQKARYLRPLAAGTIRSAFFMTEPASDNGAGSDPSMLKTEARMDGNHWVINGRKAFITGAQGAAFGIVMARTGEGQATMFLVDLPHPGVVVEHVMDTIDTGAPGGHSVIRLDEVRVPADQILGAPHEGFRYAQVRLAPARLTHCMRWTGAARRCHDLACDYARQRHAFGRPLIDHEGVGFQLADNLIDLKQAELMTDWAAAVLDAGLPGTHESSMAKVAVSEALFRVVDRCVQVMGGTGVMPPVEGIFRELRAFRIYDGPSEVHRWSIARRIRKGLA